jgi:light-regulated signal transduction histidine kinase (bacteriophytochrome)
VLQSVAAADDIVASLVRADSDFPGVCEADSAIVAIGGHREVVGAPLAPAVVDQVLGIARAELTVPDAGAVVSSITLGTEGSLDPARAAGFAAMRLDPDAEHVVVWVRGERRRSVRWVAHAVVGDTPQDELFAGLGERIEEERGTSAPWTRSQLQEIAGIREALAEVFVSRYGALHSLSAELARSNEEYDAFAHAAAHDLGSPLRGIRQNIEFFLEDVEATIGADEAEPLETAVRLTVQMRAMLDDLLAYAKIGRAAWDPQPIEIESATADVAELLGPKLDGATLVAHPGTFTTDPGALRQLLLNLLGNAAKYSGGPATISVDVTTLESAATSSTPPKSLANVDPQTEVLVVADRGIGIAEAHHERVFELFRQIDNRAEGTGTGLALCRLICRRHGGDIWLSSQAGSGTTFYVVAGR